MATPEQIQAIIRLYADLMEEIKARLGSIDSAMSGGIPLRNELLHEYCHLQLRMVCELIALSCLIAHGELLANTNLKNEWSADRIMDRLAKLHPDFYPWPIKWHPAKSDGTLPFEHVSDGFLTKEELLELNGRCGDALHRGSLTKLFKHELQIVTRFPEVTDACMRLRNLLDHHRIVLLDKNLIFCTLTDPESGGVQIAFADTDEKRGQDDQFLPQ